MFASWKFSFAVVTEGED